MSIVSRFTLLSAILFSAAALSTALLASVPDDDTNGGPDGLVDASCGPCTFNSPFAADLQLPQAAADFAALSVTTVELPDGRRFGAAR